jgi:hypothetical protein|uniref:Uncharacterized protein n=1 Tax=Bacteriophage sp. TaxID=38018 RepID=A0A8D9PF15_9VIRU|nr:MAG TPA: hypothetical protein [Bacteriophage sp.]
MENERILKALMGVDSEDKIKELLTTDMEKFNSDLANNY